MQRRPTRAVVVAALLALSACTTYTSTGETRTTTENGATAPASPSTDVTLASPATVTIPHGVLFAELGQEREDVPLSLYQVSIHNDTDGEVDVASTSLTWPGFKSSPPNTKGTKIAPHAVIDQPVAFAGASCTGNGTTASMPSVDAAKATITLTDGTTTAVPVADVNGILSKLYLGDCERQAIEQAVSITLVGFKDITLDGLPRTDAVIHLQRAASTGTIRLLDTKGTVMFTLAPQRPTASPLVSLAPGQSSADLPVLLTEARCEDHAFAETKQPFLFVVSIDPGDGRAHGYTLVPDVSEQPHLFKTILAACKIKNDAAAATVATG